MIDLEPLKKKRVAVFGDEGMLGSALVRELQTVGSDVRSWSKSDADCSDVDRIIDILRYVSPDYIISAVGYNGGIGFKRPFDIFNTNSVVPLAILDAMCRCQSSAKVMFPVASCAYDNPYYFNSDVEGRLEEYGYLYGEPNPSVQPHGYAKRATVLACRYAREQYGIKAVTVCPPTLFGPKDRYDRDRSKVVAGMIRRFVDAVDDGLKEVTCWGTGEAVRDIMYVGDAARLMLQALLVYGDSSWPMNLSLGDSISIRELAFKIAVKTGYTGQIHFDTSKPDGQLKKVCSNKLMLELLGPQESHLNSGLLAAIQDYKWRKLDGEFNG